ncbi:hypothetical protein HOA55_00540 [archaeon]|jgi:ribosomal protein L29|nr:hypothetical protein [archaeon]MBT3578255.1 hypothetical protein [archaeon]MBT6819824.1 hypothetical protein [archaeon]MBT6956600.1 hypothetical protein [archaeon]MBT7025606.1 hypothetical protein [archaeon]
MAKENKKLSEKEMTNKLRDLKIELLKNPTKKKSIKKEIARLLTMTHQGVPVKGNNQTKLGENK